MFVSLFFSVWLSLSLLAVSIIIISVFIGCLPIFIIPLYCLSASLPVCLLSTVNSFPIISLPLQSVPNANVYSVAFIQLQQGQIIFSLWLRNCSFFLRFHSPSFDRIFHTATCSGYMGLISSSFWPNQFVFGLLLFPSQPIQRHLSIRSIEWWPQRN